MKSLLATTVFALAFAAPSFAQLPKAGTPQSADVPLEQLAAVRARLIQRYVLSPPNYAWGVSVCGSEDLLNGKQHSWLTIYVYGDSVAAFKADFAKFAPEAKVDGVIVKIERRKHGD